MNKNKIVLLTAAGIIAAAVLVMAVFVYLAWAAKVAAIEGDEESDGLETVVSKATALSRKPVYPCAESVKAIDANAETVTVWCAEAEKTAALGDKVFEPTTPAAFKTFLVTDAKRLMRLPGVVDGSIVKPDFAFGPFKDYIVDAKMPADAELPRLQRQWDDIASVVEMIAASECCELTDVQFKAVAEPKDESSRKSAKKPAKKASKAKDASPKKEPSAEGYVFVFTARPPALVKLVNALSTSERFIVVDDLSIARSKDALSAALGGDEKKQEAQQSGRRRSRRAQAVVEEKKEDDAKSGIVTDPQMDEPFVVTMTATVYDFRSLEGGDKPEEVKE